ncbi:hypothetical protein HDV05_001121, partial [Chytridiales sp. JEL 0842]
LYDQAKSKVTVELDKLLNDDSGKSDRELLLSKVKETLLAMLDIEDDDAATNVAQDILNAEDLLLLGESYYWHFLSKVFGKPGTPPSSVSSSRTDPLDPPALRPSSSKFSDEIGSRDNNRCAFSGLYSSAKYPKYMAIEPLQAVHIIGYSALNSYKYSARFLEEDAVNAFPHFRAYINGSVDYSPVTSRKDDILSFGRITATADGGYRLFINGADKDTRPCPKLLKFREMLSKVLHASGRAEDFDTDFDDADEEYPQLCQTANSPGFLHAVTKKLAKLDRDRDQTMVDLHDQ